MDSFVVSKRVSSQSGILLLFVVTGIAPALAGSELVFDAPSLVAKFQEQRQSLPPYALRVETTSAWWSERERGAGMYVHQLRFDGLRLDDIMERYNCPEDAKPVYTGSTRGIWDGRRYICKQELKTMRGEDTPLSAFFSSKKERPGQLISSPYAGGFLAGYLGESTHICDILKQATTVALRPAMEDVNDHPCYVLMAETKGGRYTLWLDAARGFNLRRAVIEKTDMGPSPLKIVIDDVTIAEIDGRWIAVSGTFATSNQRFTSKRTDVKLNPDFEAMKAFVVDGIPNGTRMVCTDSQEKGVVYVWMNGRIVTTTDNRPLDPQ